MSKYNRTINKDGKHLEVDVYDVLEAFNVTCPALQHLIKKALCVGIRGHKDESQDLQDIIDSANRAIGLAEDRVDGEMLKNMDSMKISGLSKEKQEEIKKAIEKAEITGSLNPSFLKEEQEKIDNVYYFREIGEGGWFECDLDWYEHCKKSPEHDTRFETKEGSITLEASGFLDESVSAVRDSIETALYAAKQFEGETP